MRSGLLRHYITIQKKQDTPTRDDYGAEVDSWSTFEQVWANIAPISGREYFDSQRVNSNVSHKFIIRYLSGVVPTMRVSFDSRTFNIESVLNRDERGREMELMCVEVV